MLGSVPWVEMEKEVTAGVQTSSFLQIKLLEFSSVWGAVFVCLFVFVFFLTKPLVHEQFYVREVYLIT